MAQQLDSKSDSIYIIALSVQERCVPWIHKGMLWRQELFCTSSYSIPSHTDFWAIAHSPLGWDDLLRGSHWTSCYHVQTSGHTNYCSTLCHDTQASLHVQCSENIQYACFRQVAHMCLPLITPVITLAYWVVWSHFGITRPACFIGSWIPASLVPSLRIKVQLCPHICWFSICGLPWPDKKILKLKKWIVVTFKMCQTWTGHNMVKSSSPALDSYSFVPMPTLPYRTCLPSASSVLAVRISCCIITLFIFRKPLSIELYCIYVSHDCHIKYSVRYYLQCHITVVGLGT
jgi:hypothetical protein